MKIKSKGFQAFNVPNTPEGQAFIAQLRTYLNRSTQKLTARGRGTRKQHGDQRSIPLRFSEWIAVYLSLNEKEAKKALAKQYKEASQAAAERQQSRNLALQLSAARLQIDNLQANNVTNSKVHNANYEAHNALVRNLREEIDNLKIQLGKAVKAQAIPPNPDTQCVRTVVAEKGKSIIINIALV